MKFEYTEIYDKEGNLQCIHRSDGWSIPIDPANSDYQAYLNKDKAALSTPIVSDAD